MFMNIFDFEKCHLLYNMVKTMYSISQLTVWVFNRYSYCHNKVKFREVVFPFHCSHILIKLRAIPFVFTKTKKHTSEQVEVTGNHRQV